MQQKQELLENLEEYLYEEELNIYEEGDIIHLELIHPGTEDYVQIIYLLETFFINSNLDIEDYIIEGDFETMITIE